MAVTSAAAREDDCEAPPESTTTEGCLAAVQVNWGLPDRLAQTFGNLVAASERVLCADC